MGAGDWYSTRLWQCGRQSWTVVVYEYVDDEPVETGSMDVTTTNYLTSDASLTMGFLAQVYPEHVVGSAIDLSVSETTECDDFSGSPYGCSHSNANYVWGLIVPNTAYEADDAITGDSPAKGDKFSPHVFSSWFFDFPPDDPGVGTSITPDSIMPRCDNALPGGAPGCVATPVDWGYYNYSPTGSYPELAEHIRNALSTGLSNLLTRTTDKATKKANRARACPSAFTRPSGKSCDEYPFASTYEGAASVAEWLPRTFDGCSISVATDLKGVNASSFDGWSVCMINATQNSAGGSALNRDLYLAQRVIDGDYFEVSTN